MIRGIRRLSAAEWRDVATTLSIAVVVEVGLRLLKLPTLTRLLHVSMEAEEAPVRAGDHPAIAILPRRDAQRLLIVYRVMRRWPYDEKCLRRSLVAAVQIRKHSPAVVIGVSLVGGEVKAHAWLRLDGTDLDPTARDFQPLLPIDRSSGVT